MGRPFRVCEASMMDVDLAAQAGCRACRCRCTSEILDRGDGVSLRRDKVGGSVSSCSAIEDIGPELAGHGVIASVPQHSVVTPAAANHVIAFPGIDLIR